MKSSYLFDWSEELKVGGLKESSNPMYRLIEALTTRPLFTVYFGRFWLGRFCLGRFCLVTEELILLTAIIFILVKWLGLPHYGALSTSSKPAAGIIMTRCFAPGFRVLEVCEQSWLCHRNFLLSLPHFELSLLWVIFPMGVFPQEFFLWLFFRTSGNRISIQ